MTPGEVDANIEYFAVTRRDPRTPGCTALVLSGVSDASAFDGVIDAARSHGIERVTLHCGTDLALAASDLAASCDGVVVSVQSAAQADAIPSDVHAVVLLEDPAALPDISTALVEAGPERITLTWPFPGGAIPPSAADLAPAARSALDVFAEAGIPSGVKGLPLCALAPGPVVGRWAERVWRSPNRWYVDADHQCADALAFFPEVVRFSKPDSCRFCAANRRCDGVAESWIRLGLVGSLTPVPFGA